MKPKRITLCLLINSSLLFDDLAWQAADGTAADARVNYFRRFVVWLFAEGAKRKSERASHAMARLPPQMAAEEEEAEDRRTGRLSARQKSIFAPQSPSVARAKRHHKQSLWRETTTTTNRVCEIESANLVRAPM